MAVYRLHKKEWDKIVGHVPPSLHVVSGLAPTTMGAASAQASSSSEVKGKKRKRAEVDVDGKGADDDSDDHAGGEAGVDAQEAASSMPPTNPKIENKTSKKHSKSKQGSDPGQGRKGVSSGLSTVVRHKGGATSINGRKGKQVQQKDSGRASKSGGSGGEWWKELPGSGVGGKKGSMKL